MPRKKKVVEQAAPVEQHTPEEQVLQARYAQRRIVPGSLLGAGERPGHGTKRTLAILCEVCGEMRIIATSDLFQVGKCHACTKASRRKAKSQQEAQP
jgi:hypothetical protein